MNNFFKVVISFVLSVLTSIGIYHGANTTNKNVQVQNQTVVVASPTPTPFGYSDFDTVHGKSGPKAVLYISVCEWQQEGGHTNWTNNTVKVLNDFAQKGYLQYSIRELPKNWCNSDDESLAEQAFTACVQKISPQNYEQYLLALGSVSINFSKDSYMPFVQLLKSKLPKASSDQIIACVKNQDYQSVIQKNQQEMYSMTGGGISGIPSTVFPNSSEDNKIVDGEIIDDSYGFKALAKFVNFPNSKIPLSPEQKLQQQFR